MINVHLFIHEYSSLLSYTKAWQLQLLGLIFAFNFDMRMLSTAEICVRNGCTVILLAQVWSWTGPRGTEVTGSDDPLYTGLTGLTSDVWHAWSVCCIADPLRSLPPVDRRCIQLASNGLTELIGSQTAVFSDALICFQEAQTGLTEWSDRQASSFVLIFLTWLVGSETNTGKRKKTIIKLSSKWYNNLNRKLQDSAASK